MRPEPVIVPGMMPALERPGLIRPGQFGPTIRVEPAFYAYWKNCAVSWPARPLSVMMAVPGGGRLAG